MGPVLHVEAVPVAPGEERPAPARETPITRDRRRPAAIPINIHGRRSMLTPFPPPPPVSLNHPKMDGQPPAGLFPSRSRPFRRTHRTSDCRPGHTHTLGVPVRSTDSNPSIPATEPATHDLRTLQPSAVQKEYSIQSRKSQIGRVVRNSLFARKSAVSDCKCAS